MNKFKYTNEFWYSNENSKNITHRSLYGELKKLFNKHKIIYGVRNPHPNHHEYNLWLTVPYNVLSCIINKSASYEISMKVSYYGYGKKLCDTELPYRFYGDWANQFLLTGISSNNIENSLNHILCEYRKCNKLITYLNSIGELDFYKSIIRMHRQTNSFIPSLDEIESDPLIYTDAESPIFNNLRESIIVRAIVRYASLLMS